MGFPRASKEVSLEETLPMQLGSLAAKLVAPRLCRWRWGSVADSNRLERCSASPGCVQRSTELGQFASELIARGLGVLQEASRGCANKWIDLSARARLVAAPLRPSLLVMGRGATAH